MNLRIEEKIISYFERRRILVTGASGYLATNLIHSVKDIDCTIVRLSKSSKFLPVKGGQIL